MLSVFFTALPRALVCFIIFLIGQLYIQLYSKINIQNHYRQLEILMPLMNDLNIVKKIPNTRGYAASPDFLYVINIELYFH